MEPSRRLYRHFQPMWCRGLYVAAVYCREYISIFPTYDGTRRERGGEGPKTNNANGVRYLV